MKRRWLRLTAATLVAYLALCALLGVYLADVAVKPFRRAVADDAFARAGTAVQPLGARVADVTLTAADRIELRGWLFTPARTNGHAVLALHGVSGNRTALIGYAKLLLEAGYTVLTPDARAHGASGGALATFGVIERDDIARWIGWLRGRTSGCIHGFGSSMGAAQLLQTADDPTLLCSIVAESPFATFREVAFDRVGQYVGAGDWLGRTLLRPAVEAGFLTAWMRYGVDLARADPLAHVSRARIPVLDIHGLADTNIPPRHAHLIRASNPAAVTLWLVAGGRHAAAWSREPSRYPARMLGFFAAREAVAAHAAAPPPAASRAHADH